jgi:hypothetical protein
LQVLKAVNKAFEHQLNANPSPPPITVPPTTNSNVSPSIAQAHIQKLESLNMELQDLLNTTATALVDTAQKHEDARSELVAREREVENLRWQLGALQKRAEESFIVQEKMRYPPCFLLLFFFFFKLKLLRAFMKEQEANLEGSKRRVVAETEHIFREMRAELERNQFSLKMETRRREAFARAVAGVIGAPQAEALLRQSGIQPEGIGGGSESETGRSGERERGYLGTENFGSMRKEDLWSSHNSSGSSKFS